MSYDAIGHFDSFYNFKCNLVVTLSITFILKLKIIINNPFLLLKYFNLDTLIFNNYDKIMNF
jgi:hypothetical protein